jgi:hypothetical protein
VPLLGILYLSLVKLIYGVFALVYCGSRVVCPSWMLFLFLLDGHLIGNQGLILLFCGIGKDISAFCWYFLLVSFIILS